MTVTRFTVCGGRAAGTLRRHMGLLSWLVFGFLAGTLAGVATGNRREGCFTKIAVGVIGALVGGSLARAAGIDGVSFRHFTLKALLIAIVGSALLLLVLQALGFTRASRSGRSDRSGWSGPSARRYR